MTISSTMLLIMLGAAIVTIIPRILPFVFIRKIELPPLLEKWLTFIPVCIFTALIVDSFLSDGDQLINIDWLALTAIIPTLAVALWSKSLSLTVITGIVVMALLRLLF